MVNTKSDFAQPKFRLFIRFSFHTNASKVSARDVSSVEHLLRKWTRQIELYEDPGVKDCWVSEEMISWNEQHKLKGLVQRTKWTLWTQSGIMMCVVFIIKNIFNDGFYSDAIKLLCSSSRSRRVFITTAFQRYNSIALHLRPSRTDRIFVLVTSLCHHSMNIWSLWRLHRNGISSAIDFPQPIR